MFGADRMEDSDESNPDYTAFGGDAVSGEANCNNLTASVCGVLGLRPPRRDVEQHPGIRTPYGPMEWQQGRESSSETESSGGNQVER